MQIEAKRTLFFGVKLDSKLRDALSHASAGDRHYFEENSPYLRIVPLGEEQWIGKITDGGIAISEVEDIQRNVISILHRIAPGVRTSSINIRIFAVGE